MYQNLGIQWASSIPAFLSLACVPLPFAFYRFGHTIRMHSKYAAEAARITEKLLAKQSPVEVSEKDANGRSGTQTPEAEDLEPQESQV